MVVSVLLYGSETWNLNTTQLRFFRHLAPQRSQVFVLSEEACRDLFPEDLKDKREREEGQSGPVSRRDTFVGVWYIPLVKRTVSMFSLLSFILPLLTILILSLTNYLIGSPSFSFNLSPSFVILLTGSHSLLNLTHSQSLIHNIPH